MNHVEAKVRGMGKSRTRTNVADSGTIWLPDIDGGATSQAMADPQPGMVFQEMYSWWLHIVAIGPQGQVLTEEYNPPCVCPDDRKLYIFRNADKLREHYAYSSMPGHYPFRIARNKAPLGHIDWDRDSKLAEWPVIDGRKPSRRFDNDAFEGLEDM